MSTLASIPSLAPAALTRVRMACRNATSPSDDPAHVVRGDVQTQVHALAGLFDLDHHSVGVIDDGAGDVLEHASRITPRARFPAMSSTSPSAEMPISASDMSLTSMLRP